MLRQTTTAFVGSSGDGITDTGEVVTHVYPTYGYYTVYMIIDRRSSDNNCGGFDTISTFVRILQNETFIYDSVCAGFPYNANGLNIPSAQQIRCYDYLPKFLGCDSVVHVNPTFLLLTRIRFVTIYV